MPSPPRRRPSRASYHHGNLRQALIDATLELIEREDVAAVSLREVARRAGVTYGAPYHHFKDKSELLAAVAEEGFRKLFEDVAAAMVRRAADPVGARLAVAAEAYVRFATKHAAHYRVMFLPEVGDRIRFVSLHDVAGMSLDALVALIGEARPGSSPARRMELAVAAWSAWHGLASLHNERVIQNNPGLPSFDALRRAVASDIARLITGGAEDDPATPSPVGR
jgi:AcrR family transcriptional regulator